MQRRKGSFSTRMLLCLAASGVVCPAQSLFDTATVAATVVSLEGQVSILRDSSPWALQVGDKVRPRQVILAGPDGHAILAVSDGSTFEVFPNSRVVFRNNPGDWRDLLDMLIGRVKVHIQKLGGQPNRNNVHTPTAIISVRGTVFDVTVEDSDSTLVVCEEGQVEVQHAVLARSQTKVLGQGEWIRVYKDQPLAQKSVDKGAIASGVLRAAGDAIYSTIYRAPRAGGPTSGGGTGGGLPGDNNGGKKPDPGKTPGDAGPGAPPPPPPPPPH